MSPLNSIFLGSGLVAITCLVSLLVSPLAVVRMTWFQQATALIAAFCLYIYLLFDRLFILKRNIKIQKLASSFGLICACFAITHADFSLIFQLGGLVGLQLLGTDYLIPLFLGALAYVLIFIFVFSSFTFISNRLPEQIIKAASFWLKIAGILVLFHAMAIGTHFISRQGPIFYISVILFFILAAVSLLSISKPSPRS